MGFPAPSDIRNLLEGYGLDLQSTLSVTGTWTSGSAVITGINTTKLQPFMNLFGVGIPAAAQILTVDIVGVSGQVTMSVPATQNGTNAALTVTYFTVVSDNWLLKCRDELVMPLVQRYTKQSFSGLQTVTEYYDGTGSQLMILRRRPIVQLISISYTNVDSNLYYLTPMAMQVITEEGILKAKANFNESNYTPIFFRGDRNIRITYQYGWATCPDDIGRAIASMVADKALAMVGSKTGGGDLNVQAFGRGYGENGKWTHIRKELAKDAWAIIHGYMTGGGS